MCFRDQHLMIFQSTSHSSYHFSQIYVNNKRIIPAFENADFRITDNGIESAVIIPEIGAKVTFTGLMFAIYLPYAKFHGNTEGQCGEFILHSQ